MSVPFGKYLLQHKLAEGGMAEIFLSRQTGLEGFDRPVVVKRLLPQHSAEGEFIRMFLNEARLAARLNHPNIVQIFELGQEQDTYFLAMEYIRGEDLRALAETADRLKVRPPLGLICRIIIDALSGLHYAHSRTGPDGSPLGLVHRDISPQNILVSFDGRVKVIDFGIAKATQARNTEQTQAGLLKGKYAYMSPEQTRGDRLDARSDVFSAGILLWELCTWRRLFKRSTDLATLVAISDEPAPAMSLINPDVPSELDDVVLKALAVEPEQRYNSAQEFAEALEDTVAGLGWQADNRALGQFMRELFKEKLEGQLAVAREAGFGSSEEYLLSGRANPSASSRPDAGDGEVNKELPLQGLPGKVQSRSKPAPKPPQRTPPPNDGGVETVVAQSPRPGSGAWQRPPTGMQPAVSAGMAPMPSGPVSGGYGANRPPTGMMNAVPQYPAGRAPTGAMPAMHSAGMVVGQGRASGTGMMMPIMYPESPTMPPATGPMHQEAQPQRRVVIAIVIGLLCGVLLVALLTLLER